MPAGLLPPGFVAIDLAKALALPLADPDNKNASVAAGTYPKRGNGLIGADAAKPDVVVASNGGSDLVYVPGKNRALTEKVVAALLRQDYVSGLFVDDDLGAIPGTLPLSAVNLKGSRCTPRPSVVINFRSYAARLRQAGHVRGQHRRHRAAAGPRHARQLQPRRHDELHGGDRPRFQTGLRQ